MPSGLRSEETRALLVFLAISFLYFGRPVASHPGRLLIGRGSDPGIFLWSFAWVPHALLHGENPIYTHAIWAPTGIDLAWVASAPGLALVFAPLTLTAGPIVAYNVAAVLLPALAAWTAFLLCRYLTRAFWPSLIGGYLFGFSAFMLGHEEGHLHLTSAFLVPLVALVVLQYVHGRLDDIGLAVRLGLLLAAQVLLSTELFATMTLALVVGSVLAFALVVASRPRLLRLLLAATGAYALALVLAGPLVYHLLSDLRSEAVNTPDLSIDLANLVVPTRLVAGGGAWASGVSSHFQTSPVEQAAYVGVPALAIVLLFVLGRRTPGARFLLASLGTVLLAGLGSELRVDGRALVPLPWRAVEHLPVFDNILPVRLSMYFALGVAVAVALWTASERRRVLRIVLPTLRRRRARPRSCPRRLAKRADDPGFFASGEYENCIGRGENVLVIPYGGGDALLWQARSGFTFDMPGGMVSPAIPKQFPGTTVIRLAHDDVRVGDGGTVLDFARSKGVSTILLDPNDPWPWQAVLSGLGTPRHVGGMLLYPIGPGLATDPGCIED